MLSNSWRVTAALLRPTARTVFGVSSVVGPLAGAAVLLPLAFSLELDSAGLARMLRLSAVAVALGLTAALNDPSGHSTTVAVSTSRLHRSVIRLVMAATAGAIGWAGVLWLARAGVERELFRNADPTRITIEMAGFALAVLAFAAAGYRRRPGDSQIAAAAGLLCLAVLASALPRPHTMLPPPGDPSWALVHRWWVVVIVVALVAFGWFSRDPARRSLLHTLRGAGGTPGPPTRHRHGRAQPPPRVTGSHSERLPAVAGRDGATGA